MPYSDLLAWLTNAALRFIFILAEEIKKYIAHHLKDSHSFGVASYTNDNDEKVYLEIPLPVILYDNGFKFFMSSEFKHGKKVVASNENYYRIK